MLSAPVHTVFFALGSLCDCARKNALLYMTYRSALHSDLRRTETKFLRFRPLRRGFSSSLFCLCLFPLTSIGNDALPSTLHRGMDFTRAVLDICIFISCQVQYICAVGGPVITIRGCSHLVMVMAHLKPGGYSMHC